MMNALPKVDEVIFVDLFAGSGLFSIGYQREVLAGAAFRAMSSDLPFSKWVLCERHADQLSVLDKRVRKFFPAHHVEIIDSTSHLTDQLVSVIPPSKHGRRVAVICLIDPFSLDISMTTIYKLASLGYSLLTPFTFVLNSRHNCRHYVQEQPEALKRFLGEAHIDKLKDMESNLHFYKRLIRLYQNNLLVMGLNCAMSSHKLQSRMMELPAYNIGFFSKQFSTQAIQREVNGPEHFQYELF